MSTLITNTFTGKTSAGSIVVTGEGGTNTTNLQQGLAKTWWQLDGTGTAALHDSFNGGSITDHGTGEYTVALSATMDNTSYSYVYGGASQNNTGSNGVATTSLRQRTRDSSNSALDLDHTTCTIHGDLA